MTTIAQNIASAIEENGYGTIGETIFVTSPRFARSSIFVTPTGGEGPGRTIGGGTSIYYLGFSITVVKDTAEDVATTAQNLAVLFNGAIVPGVSHITVSASTPIYNGEGGDGQFYCQFDLTCMVTPDQFDVEYVIDGNVEKGSADFN